MKTIGLGKVIVPLGGIVKLEHDIDCAFCLVEKADMADVRVAVGPSDTPMASNDIIEQGQTIGNNTGDFVKVYCSKPNQINLCYPGIAYSTGGPTSCSIFAVVTG